LQVEFQRDQLQQQRNNSVTTEALVTTTNTKISSDMHLKLVDYFNLVGPKFLSGLLDPVRTDGSLEPTFMELDAFRLPNGTTDFTKVAAAANGLLRLSIDRATDTVKVKREGFYAGFGVKLGTPVSDSIPSAWRRLTEEHLEGVFNFPSLAESIFIEWVAMLTPSIFKTQVHFSRYPVLRSTLLAVSAQAARLAAWCAVANDKLRVHCPKWQLDKSGVWVNEGEIVHDRRGFAIAGDTTGCNICGLYPIAICSDYSESSPTHASMWAVPAVLPDLPTVPMPPSASAASYPVVEPAHASRSHSDGHAPPSGSRNSSVAAQLSSLFATAPAAFSPSSPLPRSGTNNSDSADPHASSLRGTV
jgi:hypothetical protein